MRTFRIATAVAVAALVMTIADPAAAKGPRSASIDGPGLDAPIEESMDRVVKLPALTGLYGALWADPMIPLLEHAPTSELGPPWEITWDMGEYVDETGTESDGPDLVRQTVYPYADGGPLVYTDPDQPFYGERTIGGWYEAHTSLTDMLRSLGLPGQGEVGDVAVPTGDDERVGGDSSAGSDDGDDGERVDLAAGARPDADAASDGSSTDRVAGWVAGLVLVTAVAAVAVLRSRRHATG